MRKLRVLVANRPPLMREAVLETLSGQPDLEIVGETGNETEVTELVDRTRPDCVIVALDAHDTRLGLCGFLLGRYPQMKVLAVTSERGSSTFYWAVVEIHSRPVETSEEGLLGALRSSVELQEVRMEVRTATQTAS